VFDGIDYVEILKVERINLAIDVVYIAVGNLMMKMLVQQTTRAMQ